MQRLGGGRVGQRKHLLDLGIDIVECQDEPFPGFRQWDINRLSETLSHRCFTFLKADFEKRGEHIFLVLGERHILGVVRDKSQRDGNR